jgi:NitT/TauT family transport system permease protein
MRNINLAGQKKPNKNGLISKLGRLLDRRAVIVSVITFMILWELIARITNINPMFLPTPSSVGLELIEISNKGLLWGPLWESGQALIVGLAISIVVGVPLGILFGAINILDMLSTPYMWALRATPRIAIAPLLAIWAGFGFTAKLWMIFLSAGILIMLITQEGVKTVDQNLVRVARSFGANRLKVYSKVVFPFILPFIANAIRNGIGMGIVGLLIIEMYSSGGGFGYQVMRASYTHDGPRLYGLILVLMTVSLLLVSISRRLEMYVSRWREEAYV